MEYLLGVISGIGAVFAWSLLRVASKEPPKRDLADMTWPTVDLSTTVSDPDPYAYLIDMDGNVWERKMKR